MNRLLSLDQSSRISGYAIFEDGKYLTHGKFVVDENDIGERLYIIRNKVCNLIEKYNIDEVAFEDIQLQNNVINNVQTFKILAEVIGIIEELLTEKEIPYTSYLASSWKSTLGIKGKNRAEQKRNAQKYIVDTYGIKPTQDECDAICIGLHALSKTKPVPDHDWSD